VILAAAFVPARTVTEHDFDLVTISTFDLSLDRSTLLASLGAVGFAGLGLRVSRPLTLLRRTTAAPVP
jgi:hypothetical protein